MCGRVRLPEDVSELKVDLGLAEVWRDRYEPRWNVPPTCDMPVVTNEDGRRVLQRMRWGLIPFWAKDAKVGYSTFNARSDGVDTKPAFKGAWNAGRRCLIVTEGFYEWRKADKQPFAVALHNRGPMLMAGLWDTWRAPDGGKVKSCTIITTDANEAIAPIHNRMPVVLQSDDWPAWLSEVAASPDELKAMLRPHPDRLDIWPVDKRVGNVKNESADLIEPLTGTDDAA